VDSTVRIMLSGLVKRILIKKSFLWQQTCCALSAVAGRLRIQSHKLGLPIADQGIFSGRPDETFSCAPFEESLGWVHQRILGFSIVLCVSSPVGGIS
jgi:hypothetical protein